MKTDTDSGECLCEVKTKIQTVGSVCVKTKRDTDSGECLCGMKTEIQTVGSVCVK